MDEREQRGLEIAAKAKLQRSDDGYRWFVPSQTKGCHDTYIVKPDALKPHCTCPDFTARQLRCKHIYATEIVIKREYTDDGETQTLTETVTVKKTYKQEWTAYNRAQTHEKERFLSLLAELCKGIEEAPQTFGRPRLPLADMIFASTFKVYSTFSGRRFTSDLRDAQSKGYLTRAPHFNSISRYLENPTLTPFLKQLIEVSSLPLQAVETSFTADSSGSTTCRFAQWVKAKYSDKTLMD